jgi:hypothetical protein
MYGISVILVVATTSNCCGPCGICHCSLQRWQWPPEQPPTQGNGTVRHMQAGKAENPLCYACAVLSHAVCCCLVTWATVARDSIAALSSLPPLASMEGYTALSAAVRGTLVGSMTANVCVA